MPPSRRPTHEIAEILAHTAALFPCLGSLQASDLIASITLELGHPEILDGFRPYGSHLSYAIPKNPLLHIVSGNTPHAALQSLIRGLLLQSHNRMKLPTGGLPEVDAFIHLLPPDLVHHIECAQVLPDTWIQEAEAVIIFGSDNTLHHFRQRIPEHIPIQAHGHRISFGIIFSDPTGESLPHTARDISLYDQQGCLSPQVIYVQENNLQDPHFSSLSPIQYASQLAQELEKWQQHTPRSALNLETSAQLIDLRAWYEWQAAQNSGIQVWSSPHSTAWTVVYDPDPTFTLSPLNRFIFIKPLPHPIEPFLQPFRSHLGAIGIWPPTPLHATRLAHLGASRICPLGSLQFPAWTWHTEGLGNFTSLIKWVDFEHAAG